MDTLCTPDRSFIISKKENFRIQVDTLFQFKSFGNTAVSPDEGILPFPDENIIQNSKAAPFSDLDVSDHILLLYEDARDLSLVPFASIKMLREQKTIEVLLHLR